MIDIHPHRIPPSRISTNYLGSFEIRKEVLIICFQLKAVTGDDCLVLAWRNTTNHRNLQSPGSNSQGFFVCDTHQTWILLRTFLTTLDQSSSQHKSSWFLPPSPLLPFCSTRFHPCRLPSWDSPDHCPPRAVAREACPAKEGRLLIDKAG